MAAPTAGLALHGRPVGAIRARGALVCSVTLHVGPGTFAPVQTETIEAHTMHEERFELTAETALAINQALESRQARRGGRHHHRARAGERRGRPCGPVGAGRRAHADLSPSSPPLPGGGSAAHQFPSPPFHAADAGERVCRAGRNARAGDDSVRLCGSDPRAVSIFQLRRRHAPGVV